MKRFTAIFALIALISIPVLLFTSCEKDDADHKGTMHLSITDAPIDNFNITGVFITVTEIHYNHNGNWVVFEEFEGPQTYNLLDLTHGTSELLGSFELEAGTYTQIRFLLDAPTMGGGIPSNPGCYIEFEGGTTAPLFVPSGAQTGYKATGTFTVPANGDVYITADWDVRKSIVVAGITGNFLLKPTIRLVVEDQAGMITGTVVNIDANTDVVVYAYAAGEYDESEADDPEPETPRFPNAISSDMVHSNGNFTLAFMAQGSYDLVVTAVVDGEFSHVIGIVEGVEVTSQQTTNVTIDIDVLTE
jgi:hypothetical protein